MQVAKALKIVLKSSRPYIVVKLDMDLIEALHMRVSAESVCHSILNHPKIKLKSEVNVVLGTSFFVAYLFQCHSPVGSFLSAYK